MGTDPLPLDEAAAHALSGVTTATLTTVLLKKGLRNVWMRGSKSLRSGQGRVVGRAFTLRFVPVREDLATPESWSAPISTRAAIEQMPSACVVVVDAMGVTDAGIFGDILCARMKKRGVAALITDGTVRDVAGVLGTDLPVWCSGVAAPPSVAGSRSWVGSSRSAVAVWLSSRMTWWWPMTTARCSYPRRCWTQ
jgi:regulator of RNase E activity RraA